MCLAATGQTGDRHQLTVGIGQPRAEPANLFEPTASRAASRANGMNRTSARSVWCGLQARERRGSDSLCMYGVGVGRKPRVAEREFPEARVAAPVADVTFDHHERRFAATQADMDGDRVGDRPFLAKEPHGLRGFGTGHRGFGRGGLFERIEQGGEFLEHGGGGFLKGVGLRHHLSSHCAHGPAPAA